MTLTAHVDVRARDVSATIDVATGESLVLVGPNGSGKSTVVEAIAGVVTLDAGAVAVDGRQYSPRARGRAREASPRVALVPQDGLLLPHLSVLDNVAFGLRARGARRADARATASAVLERIEAAHLTRRRPHELSGGEARRIAIARALALDPQVVLLDEPFAGLDVDVAADIRALVMTMRAHTTLILTTHDAADAVLFGDRVAVLDKGRIVESGPPTDVFTHPRTAFAARMAGRVLVPGVMAEGVLVTSDGDHIPVSSDHAVGQRAAIAVRPADIQVQPVTAPQDSAYTWMVRPLTGLEPRTDSIRVHGGELAADIEPEHAHALVTGGSVAFGIRRGVTAYAL